MSGRGRKRHGRENVRAVLRKKNRKIDGPGGAELLGDRPQTLASRIRKIRGIVPCIRGLNDPFPVRITALSPLAETSAESLRAGRSRSPGTA
jgi:hypothetical protein